jgi:predicted nucleic acid-binding protein
VIKYVLDTQLYIRANRSPDARDALERFVYRESPRMHAHAVVVRELLVGARDSRGAREIHELYAAPWERRGRIVTPSYRSWRRSGEMIAELLERQLISRGGYTASFVNDVLIAASCREAGVTLITANTADFERIREVEPSEFAAPWPAGAEGS